MKLTDYMVISTCPVCDKPIFTPSEWHVHEGKSEHPSWSGGQNRPKYPTCLHQQAEGGKS